MAGKAKTTAEVPEDVQMDIIHEVYKTASADADVRLAAMRESLNSSHQLGLIAGRAQAFSSMELIAEFLGYKQIAQILDSEDYLKIPGVTSAEDYFSKLGISRSAAYRNLKIARTLTAEEVSMLGTVGFTRRDLLSYASLPEEKRLEIREGKVLNIESASREEIKDVIEEIIAEAHKTKEEADKAVTDAASDLKAKDKVLKSKEEVIQKQERDLSKFTRYAKAKEQTPEEYGLLQKIETLGVELHGWCRQIETVRDGLIESPYPNACAAFITLVDNIKMKLSAFRTNAVDMTPHGMVGDDGDDWQPPVKG